MVLCNTQGMMLSGSLFGCWCYGKDILLIMKYMTEVLFHELDFNKKDLHITKTFSNRAYFANMEVKGIADGVCTACHEMNNIDATLVGLFANRSYRKDQENFANSISLAGYDDNGNITVKFSSVDEISIV